MEVETLGNPEGLTDAERAYFSSGGADVAALEKEYGGNGGSGAANGATEAPAAAAAPPAAASPGADTEDDDGAITIGADGKARDTVSGKYVPHSAMHKERERRKAAESELGTVRERLARGEERLAVLTEMLAADGGKPASSDAAAPGAAPAKAGAAEVDPLDEEPIDPDEDIFGALKQAQRQNKALRERMTKGQAQQQARDESQQFQSTYRSDALSFAKKTPDFGDAYNYLIDNMHAELKAMGIDDEAARDKAIAAREREFVSGLIAAKRSPAAALYELAKVRGFQRKAAPAPTPTAAPAASAPAADASAVAKLEAINKAKDTAVSLGGAGGSAGGEVLTLETLANMPEAEFEQLSLRLGKHKMRALMGG